MHPKYGGFMGGIWSLCGVLRRARGFGVLYTRKRRYPLPIKVNNQQTGLLRRGNLKRVKCHPIFTGKHSAVFLCQLIVKFFHPLGMKHITR